MGGDHTCDLLALTALTCDTARIAMCGGSPRACCVQTPDAVIADITPAERAKYDGHFAKVKRTGGWVDARTAKQFFAKAGLPVCWHA